MAGKTSGGGIQLGSIIFVLGLVFAVTFGLGIGKNYADILIGIIMLLGVLVGLLNVTSEEITSYMFSGLVLVLVSYYGMSVLGERTASWLTIPKGILEGFLLLFIPAIVAVAMKTMFAFAKSK